MMDYDVVFSKRKTVSLSVKCGKVILKAPYGAPRKILDSVVEKHREWIEKQLAIQSKKEKAEGVLTPQVIADLRKNARAYFNEKTAVFADIMGLKYSSIKITSARHRFGSCSSKGNICFSYMLMLYPEQAREYVIVHELSHLVHMNHSAEFYRTVEKFMPDWKSRKALLKNTDFSDLLK